MAYFNNPELEDENEDNSQGMNSTEDQTQPVQLSNQSATLNSTGPTLPKAPKSNASGSGPGFQNYAKANQGKAQDNLNASVAKNVANAGQAASTAINQASQQFNTRADQGALGGQQSRATAVSDAANTTQSARNLTAGSAIDQSQQDRFKEVINAQYQGPESLRQAGLYNPASQATQVAQNKVDNTKTAMGREDLLKQIYSQRGDYTTGLNKLDSALLNASEQGVKNLQNVAAQQGNLGQKLDQAQIGSANTAQNLTGEVGNIRKTARDNFTNEKKAEEAATEARLASVYKDWNKLPDYFKDIIRNKEKTNSTILNKSINDFKKANNYDSVIQQKNALAPSYQEALAQKNALAGNRISQNASQIENLYAQSKALAESRPGGVIDPAIQREYDLLQQQKNQLAQIDAKIKQYDTASNNATKLESQLQDMNDKFNSDAVILNPYEASILGVKSGEGLYNLGTNAIKTGTYDKNRLISKDEQARQAALASLAGLDQSQLLDTNLRYTDANKAGTNSILDSLDTAATRKILNASEKNFRDSADVDLVGMGQKKNKSSGKTYYATEEANFKDALSNAGYDFKAPTSSKDLGNQDLLTALANVSEREDLNPNSSAFQNAVNAHIEGFTNAGQGTSPVADGVNMVGSYTGLNALASVLGQDNLTGLINSDYNPYLGVSNFLGNTVGLGDVGSNVLSAVGLGKGTNSKASKSEAAKYAQQDLENKLQGMVDSTGFNNRFAVADDKAVTSRMNALQQLLAGLDKTNA